MKLELETAMIAHGGRTHVGDAICRAVEGAVPADAAIFGGNNHRSPDPDILC